MKNVSLSFLLALVLFLPVAQASLPGLFIKTLTRTGVKEGGEAVAKKGASVLVRRVSRTDLIRVMGSQPVERITKLVLAKPLAKGTTLAAHNPNKEAIWKTIADCARVEAGHGDAKYLIESSLDASRGVAKMNSKSLYEMYRYARMNKLTTPENVKRMEQGLAPKFPDGEVAHLDHIIPVKYAPELKTMPANLRILRPSDNMSRGAAADRHCRSKIREIQMGTENSWNPSFELRQAMQAAGLPL